MCLCFTLFISAIQARPYDASDLQALFDSPAFCQKPCWQEIRPGISTAEEAVALLRQNRWVIGVTAHEHEIEWLWSGSQPDLVSANEPGRIVLKNQRVFAILIPVNIHLGDLYFLYGSPHWNSTGHGQGKAHLSLTYPAEYLNVSVLLDCPVTRSTLWLSQPEIQLQPSSQNGLVLTTLSHSRHVGC
jgi:hypothetical protein